MFSSLIGQKKTKEYFRKVVSSGKMPHSYIFYGPVGVGKTAAAIDLAKYLLCRSEDSNKPCEECVSCAKFRNLEHPDLLFYFPMPVIPDKKKEISVILKMRTEFAQNPYTLTNRSGKDSIHIDKIRDIKKRLIMQSYQGKGRVVIITGSDLMTVQASNSLLKVLEEPPQDITMILVTSILGDLLPTIRSRCQLLHFSNLSADDISRALVERENLSEEEAQQLAYLSEGSYSKALDYWNDDFSETSQDCAKFIETCSEKTLLDSVEIVEEFSGKYRKNPNGLRSLLDYLSVLVKSYYENVLVNENDANQEQKLIRIPDPIKKLSKTSLENLIDETEKSVDLLNKNVYLNLILMNLNFKLRNIFNDA
ncbi:DNA polymerase III subunit delta' [candidate division KSB1 bacterium]